jgi:hypothetical protein
VGGQAGRQDSRWTAPLANGRAGRQASGPTRRLAVGLAGGQAGGKAGDRAGGGRIHITTEVANIGGHFWEDG